jgi:hypothetical protein
MFGVKNILLFASWNPAPGALPTPTDTALTGDAAPPGRLLDTYDPSACSP